MIWFIIYIRFNLYITLLFQQLFFTKLSKKTSYHFHRSLIDPPRLTNFPREWINTIHPRKKSWSSKKGKKERSRNQKFAQPTVHCPTTSKLEFSRLRSRPLSIPGPIPVPELSITGSRGSPPLNTIFWSPWRWWVRRGWVKHDSGWKGRVKSRISPLWRRRRRGPPIARRPRDGHVDG